MLVVMKLNRLVVVMALLNVGLFSVPLYCLAENWIDRIDAYVNSDPDSAIILCNEALNNRSRLVDDDRISLITIRGNASFALGDYTAAISDFRQAVTLAENVADTMACVNSLSDLGVAYRVSQRPDSAIICYNRALDMLKGKNVPDMEANILTSIAVLFANQGRFDEAVSYAEKGFGKAMMTDDIETQIYAGSSLGSALFLSGEQKRGLAAQRKVVSLAERKGVARYILKTYASMIAMHNRIGDADSVRYYIGRGQALVDKVPEASIESIGFMEQSFVVLTDMGRYRESLDIQMKILGMQDSRPFMPLPRLYQRIALNYKGLGDIEGMNDAYLKAIALTDSIHESDINEQMSEFEVRYRTAEKELAIASLQSEKSRRGMIIAIMSAVIVVALVLMWVYMRSRRRKAELANIRARLDGIEQERARLAHELHDGVCNDLLGVELTLASGDCDITEISEMVRAARQDVRTISHELLPPQFNVLSLSQLVAAYARKNEDFLTYHPSDIPVSLSPEQSVNLYRIIQEWIANMRRYGSATGAVITLVYSDDDDKVSLEITDDGAAFDPSVSGGTGLGLENIRRRVAALQGTMDFTRKDGRNVMSVKFFN